MKNLKGNEHNAMKSFRCHTPKIQLHNVSLTDFLDQKFKKPPFRYPRKLETNSMDTMANLHINTQVLTYQKCNLSCVREIS